MTAHDRRYLLRSVGASSVIALSTLAIGLSGAQPASAQPASAQPATAQPSAVRPTAAPVAPATAEEAKQAWLSAARRSEAYNEQVLAADAVLTSAKKTAAVAADTEFAAAANTAAEQTRLAAADAVVAAYQEKVDAFANASFQGARLTELSLLLTVGSPEDYLDQASSLNQVAADRQVTLTGALAARSAADAARARAQAAQSHAQKAMAAADRATTDAQTARVDLDTGKKKLTAEIAAYQLAYARLSTADIDAAVSGAQSALDPASRTRHAEQAAQRHRSALPDDAAPVVTSPEFFAWAARHAPNPRAGIAVEAALSRQGLPYVWAAEGPDSFDCSSLMMWAWHQAGVSIPRNSAAQADALPEIPLDQLQPGDLVTFYAPVSHVGMYVGDGKVLHASMPGVPIKVVPLAAAGPNPTGHQVHR